MDARRLVLRDLNDIVIKSLDISDVEHANSQCQMTIAVETRCELGDWHEGQVFNVAPWVRLAGQPAHAGRLSERRRLLLRHELQIHAHVARRTYRAFRVPTPPDRG